MNNLFAFLGHMDADRMGPVHSETDRSDDAGGGEVISYRAVPCRLRELGDILFLTGIS